MDVSPKLRAKGKTGAIEALLADDAVSAAAPIPDLSDRARRRLFERLVSFTSDVVSGPRARGRKSCASMGRFSRRGAA
jgi:hypothetical protein